MADTLTINGTFSFSTQAPGILGSTVTNAVLKSICDYSTAMKVENIKAKYRNIYPSLPSGYPSSPENVTFYIFTTSAGETSVMAEPWIDLTTVTAVTTISAQYTVVNSSSTEMANIAAALNALGVSYTVEIL